MNAKQLSSSQRPIRSFVIREGRFTTAQKKALSEYWPKYGIPIASGKLDFDHYFENKQPVVMDVGFGNGDSLLSLAQQREDLNFIGVEVYRPGIGNVLRKLEAMQIENVRVVNADVNQLLQSHVQADYLDGMVIWFPDPWPKKRHHKRRLVQTEFLLQAIKVMRNQAVLHLASDWQPYVESMRGCAAECDQLIPMESDEAPLKLQRPPTRFEQKGLKRGHVVTDLYFQVKK